jgi:hypothetical protein
MNTPVNGIAAPTILEGLDRRQKERLLAELAKDLFGELDGVETIIDDRHEAVGYFMSLAARERCIAAALGFSSAEELPSESRGPYFSPTQTIAYLESLAPSDADPST